VHAVQCRRFLQAHQLLLLSPRAHPELLLQLVSIACWPCAYMCSSVSLQSIIAFWSISMHLQTTQHTRQDQHISYMLGWQALRKHSWAT
jgi:hypothetical protein